MARWNGWERVRIGQEDGVVLDPGDPAYDTGLLAVAPVIISASRSTDIPAFYGDWFMDRLRKGYVAWANPFSGRLQYVSFSRSRVLVFWSKNPRPFLPALGELGKAGYNILFLFTLNDYHEEGLEPGVPPLDERIRTFSELSSYIGAGRLTWRFDPILLSETLTVERLMERIQGIGDRLHRHTRRMVISFIDIGRYARVRQNLAAAGFSGVREPSREEIMRIARWLSELNEGWGLEIQVCGEESDLSSWGMGRGSCIPYDTLIREFSHDRVLTDFLRPEEDREKRMRELKDPGQRRWCGCVVSKDIGHYSTCMHGCQYCYANASPALVDRNYRRYCGNRDQGIFLPALVE
jgi:hypothetical protein